MHYQQQKERRKHLDPWSSFIYKNIGKLSPNRRHTHNLLIFFASRTCALISSTPTTTYDVVKHLHTNIYSISIEYIEMNNALPRLKRTQSPAYANINCLVSSSWPLHIISSWISLFYRALLSIFIFWNKLYNNNNID